MRNLEPIVLLAIGPAPGIVATAPMEPRRLVLVLTGTAMVNDDGRWRRRPRRWWPIKQIPQVILELQVGTGSPRNSLDRQIRPPVTSGEGRPGGTCRAVGRFVLHVELAQGVHQGAVLVLPALLQQRLGRNVVQIVCRIVPGSKEFKGILVFRDSGKICSSSQ